MPTTVEGIEQAIKSSTAVGFRGQLLARGQARSMIWRDGNLPPDAPSFAPTLTYDLLSYGYSLLGLGLRLTDLGGDEQMARVAFEHAAGAIESVITNGSSTDDERGFNRVLAASAHHLARYSAQAYSILRGISDNRTLSPIERILTFLMMRSFDELYQFILEWREENRASDDDLISLLEKETLHVDNNDDITPANADAVLLALVDSYMCAIARFLLALERAEIALLEEAISQLEVGLECCAELNLVPQWWAYRVTARLLRDLWSLSLHDRLPKLPDLLAANTWLDSRELFIAHLYKRRRAEIELWPSQLDGAKHAVSNDGDLVVSLPTSAGKTRIAELCILRCLVLGKRVVFITPLRALSAQTEVTLQKTFLPLGKTISTLYGSIGTSGLDEDILRTSDIVVATPEKLDFALRNDPTLLDDVGLVVLDEGHMIGIGEREVRYEAQIQRLLKRTDANKRRIVCLSAILPDGDELEDFVAWLSRDNPDALTKNDWRPTRLRYGEVIWKGDSAELSFQVSEERPFIPKFIVPFVPPGRRKLFPCSQRELCLATAWKLVEEGKSVLIFCPQRRSVGPLAEAIVDLNKRGALANVLKGGEDALAAALAIGHEWLGEDHDILKCLKLGVAIHHGALPSPYRKEIERLLREGVLQVTVSSPTLAQGLNLSASALVVQGLAGHSGPLEVSEFRNIEGRAGRAYVDVEGLVVHPMFDKISSRQKQWRDLIAAEAKRRMESGLLRLLAILLTRMQAKLGDKNLDRLIDYVTNNAKAWDFPQLPGEDADTEHAKRLQWEGFLTSLDTAALSLLGEQEIDTADIETSLDTLLSSSLLDRRLRRKENLRRAMYAAITSRTKYIWSRTTPLQRRGYFLAGVGYNSGSQLDAVADEATPLLITANSAILHPADETVAIQAILKLAKIIFSIPPFVPDPLPTNWEEILKVWLRGKPIQEISGQDRDEVLRFVEGGLVYRLPWGLEALRVRGLANNYTTGDGLTLDAFELGLAAAAVETGSLNRYATLLMQAGFTSRLAAIKVVDETRPNFTNGFELRLWLNSDSIETLSASDSWPTPETVLLWRNFRASFAIKRERTWKRQEVTMRVDWASSPSAPSEPLHLHQSASGVFVYSADLLLVGRVTSKINPNYSGLPLATATTKPTSINVTYFGPNDLFA